MAGFGLAGAAAGLGQELIDFADQRQKLADDLLKMEKADDIRRGQMDYAAELKGQGGSGRSGGSRRSGSSGGSRNSSGSAQSNNSSGKELSPRDRDDLSRMYKSSFGDDYLGSKKPNEAQFMSYVEKSWAKGETLAQAASRAAKDWREETVVDTQEVDRAALSPMRLIGDDTYTVETPRVVGGFGQPETQAPASTPAPSAEQNAPSAASSAPPAPQDPSARQVGVVYAAPDGRKVRWTGEGWEIVDG